MIDCDEPPPPRRLVLRGGGGVWAQDGDVWVATAAQASIHTCCHAPHTHKHNMTRHTYVMTPLWETEPQRVIITLSQWVAGSCLFVCDFWACCAHVAAITTCWVCVRVCVDEDSCLIEFLPWCALLPSLHHHIYRPLYCPCSVTPQNSNITPVISPHSKSLLNLDPCLLNKERHHFLCRPCSTAAGWYNLPHVFQETVMSVYPGKLMPMGLSPMSDNGWWMRYLNTSAYDCIDIQTMGTSSTHQFFNL